MTDLRPVIVHAAPNGLVVLDEDRRTYMAISRDGSYYHLIQAADAEHPLVRDQLARVGQLVCSCPGGRFRAQCYRLAQANAHEASIREARQSWFGERVEAVAS